MKKNIIFYLFVLTTIFWLSIGIDEANAVSISSPYYTYTADSNGNLIKTTEAYTPGKQIYEINNERFSNPEHIFVDELDYIYIADSKAKKVFVLDENYQYVTAIEHEDLSFPRSTFVTEDIIYVVDFKESTVNLFDKAELLNNHQVVLLKTIGQPKSPIFDEGYRYKPQNIAVDPRGNLYVQGVGSTNGLMMIDEDGNFMTFFGGNPVRVPLLDRIRSLFLTKTQEDKMEKIFVDFPTALTIDQKGYIYTVTSSIPSNPIKKFNVSGTNYFKSQMIGNIGMNSISIGQYNNIFSVDNEGFIYEYDINGNLLFMFGGKDFSSNRVGILNRPVSIASNSRDEILVLDQGNMLIQIYQPTEFTNTVHEALDQYQKGDYEASSESWKYILQYNTLFDYAHIGLGDAYVLANDYESAYNEYYLAKNYTGISDAFWGIRQDWLQDNLSRVLFVIVLLILVRIIYVILNKFYDYSSKIHNQMGQIRSKSRILDELLYIFTFLRHPFDGFYAIKRQNRVSVLTSSIIYGLLALIYVLNYQYTNLLFIPKEGINIAYELFVLVLVVIIWVVSNYLICSINDGEGSFKNVYNATAYSLSPILVIMPFIIFMSNGLTYQERIFYDLGYTIIFIWTAFLMFFMIKDIHNYEVKETISVILKSLFTMLIIGLFLFIVNALSSQMFSVIKEIVSEVLNR